LQLQKVAKYHPELATCNTDFRLDADTLTPSTFMPQLSAIMAVFRGILLRATSLRQADLASLDIRIGIADNSKGWGVHGKKPGFIESVAILNGIPRTLQRDAWHPDPE
jgi:hypothetical protein